MTDLPDTSLQAAQIVVVTLSPTFDLILEVDDFRIGEHQLGRELQRVPAGKGLNVSRTLDSLGSTSVITGFVGRQSMAEFERFLADTAITGQFFAVPGHTRQNVTIIDPSRATDTHIRQQGLQVTRQDLERMGNKLSLLAENGTLVVFAGSLPLGVAPADLAHLLRICSQAGAKTVIDCSGKVLAEVISQGPWLIKPNRAEFAQLVRRDDQTIEQMAHTARELTDRVDNILISLGEQGAMLVNKQSAIRASMDPAKAAKVVNTVGSGDSLLGAFLTGLVQGQDLKTSLSRAVAVSWAACQTSLPASFEAQLAQRVRPQVTVQQIG